MSIDWYRIARLQIEREELENAAEIAKAERKRAHDEQMRERYAVRKAWILERLSQGYTRSEVAKALEISVTRVSQIQRQAEREMESDAHHARVAKRRSPEFRRRTTILRQFWKNLRLIASNPFDRPKGMFEVRDGRVVELAE